MDKMRIEIKLQSLLDKLHVLVEETGSFTHPAVLAISEEADQLIVDLQLMKIKAKSYQTVPFKCSKSSY